MAKPIQVYEDTIKKYGITEEVLPNNDAIIGFLQGQKQEMQGMLVRELINVVHAKGLQASKEEALRQKGLSNEAEHVNALKRANEGVQRIDSLIEDLREE